MLTSRHHQLCGVVFIAAALLCRSGFSQQSIDGADLFPTTTTVYLEVPNPDELIDEILNHPVRDDIEALEAVRDFQKSVQFKQFKIGTGFISAQIGEDWLEALKKLTAGGIHVGFDARNESVSVAFRSSDEELLKRSAGTLLNFASRESGEQVDIEEYRTGKLADLDNVTIGRFGEWFFASNHRDTVKEMADRLLDDKSGLTESKLFRSLDPESSRASADAWALVDLDTIRRSNQAEELFAGSTDDPSAELLIGGILEAFKTADAALVDFSLTGDNARLTARLPFDGDRVNPAREFFFGNAPAPLDIPDTLGQIVSYRDVGAWWLAKEDLFPENVVAQLAQGDSEISTLFGGMDFGEEVLGALQPGMRIIAKRQEFDDESRPDIQLPSFALVTKLKDPSVSRRLGVSFQSMMALININSGMMDYPQLEISKYPEDGYTLTGGEYLLEGESRKGLIIHNFSPALAFQGEYMIVSSTLDFAREIAEATKKLPDDEETSHSNTLITLNADAIGRALSDNRDALIAQMMVNDGKDRDQAASELDLLLGIIDYLDQGRLDFRVEPDQLAMDVELSFKD